MTDDEYDVNKLLEEVDNLTSNTTQHSSVDSADSDSDFLKELLEEVDDIATDLQERSLLDDVASFEKEFLETKHKFEKAFGGDKLTSSCLHEIEKKSRVGYCEVRFRSHKGNSDDSFRISLIKDMFVHDPIHEYIRECPKFDIQLERGVTDELSFLKRLYSGWCVQIDAPTFLKYAYGDGCGETSSIHMLIIRGPNILKEHGDIPKSLGVSVQISCFNDGLHQSRLQQRDDKKREVEERAKDMKVSLASFDSWWGTSNDDDNNNDAVDAEKPAKFFMKHLSVFFDPCIDHSPNENIIVLKTEHSSLDDLHKQVKDGVLSVVSENLKGLQHLLVSGLQLTCFNEKYLYWNNIRSSEATTQQLICRLFDACLGGETSKNGKMQNVVFEDARTLAENYKRDYNGKSNDYISSKLVAWQASVTAQTGFLTGFGGFLTMPITIPTGMLATWVISTRLSLAVAHCYGHDIFHPTVAAAVLYCLVGSSGEEEGEDSDMSVEDTVRQKLAHCIAARTYDSSFALTVSGNGANQKECLDLEFLEDILERDFESLYDLLGVSRSATQKDIRLAYYKLAREYHPDKVQDASEQTVAKANTRFQMLGAAYEELSDPDRRKQYDAKLEKGSWKWEDFTWDQGMEKAKTAYESANRHLHQARFSTHLVGRTATKVATEVLEEVGAKSAAQVGMKGVVRAELASSLQAGERLAARASASSGSRLIPLVGAILSAAIDSGTTLSVGRCAIRVFKVEAIKSR